MGLLLTDLVEVSEGVRAVPGRRDKVALLAELLGRTAPQEAEACIGLLVGRIRQGRIGLGWRTLESAGALGGTPEGAATPLAVLEVDAVLDRIAGLSGSGSAVARQGELVALFARASTAERSFLTHALLGDVRTGALDGILTEALAVALGAPRTVVRRAVMVTGDLGRTAAAALADPGSLTSATLHVGTPVQPMLASTAADVGAALAITGSASVEHKLDGARIQVHRKGSHISVHTRSLADVTARVPEIVSFAEGLSAAEFILDGETLMLDDAGAPRPFQETMSRFGRLLPSDQEANAPVSAPDRPLLLAPRFFDLLSLDGRDLTDAPLGERRALLADLVGSDHLIPGTVTDDPAVAQQVLDEALGLGHEGVLVKGIDSTYAAGRRGKSWVKVKPVHTLDLVALAAEWGYGRRTGWLSNLHLGARDPLVSPAPDGATQEAGEGFVMVGKTFKGLTDELLRWQTETFPTIAVRESAGVMWLRPQLVVEIAVDGVQRSSRYPGGVALRFARVRAYRPDKTAAEADTIDTVRALLRD